VSYSNRARPQLGEHLERLLVAIGAGHDTLAGLTRAGFAADQALAGLSELELMGYVRRGPGGRFEVVP
jgi:predicted Rossmann fold nucleotide-binding protein DprA/Smf involved in DNA uptake